MAQCVEPQYVDDLLDRVEQAVARAPGRNTRGSRHFAAMLAGTVSANAPQEKIALEEIASAMERIADRQLAEQQR